MKVSIITAVFNNKSCIEACMQSVLGQTYRNIEYIVIDGGSTDGTLELIKRYGDRISKWTSGPDNGIYDALNNGLGLATGDVIGFLHADDIYANDRVIEKVALELEKRKVDSCYGDLLYVDSDNPEKVIRYWRASPYRPGLFERGWMPPHPTFFVRKKVYEKYGCFNTEFRIAADYELMLRFLEKHRISTWYIPEVLIRMRTGGASNKSLTNLLTKTAEDYRAWRVNNLKRNFYTIPFKNLSKIPQFFKKW
jgi:glycosyltransferase involved in cell wall biosynthesis